MVRIHPDYYDKERRLLAYWYNVFANVMGSEAAPEQLDHNGAAGSGTDEDIEAVLAILPVADDLDDDTNEAGGGTKEATVLQFYHHLTTWKHS